MDTRICKKFGSHVHPSKSPSTRFIICWKFLLEMEIKEGKTSTPMYWKLPTTGICVGNVEVSRDELRGISEDCLVNFIAGEC